MFARKLVHVLALVLSLTGVTWADDVTSQVAIKRSALILNRSTNTFDAVVTVTNTGAEPLLPPFRVLASITPNTVSLANGTGVTTQGLAYIEIPLPGNQLTAGNSVSTAIKIHNLPRTKFSLVLTVDAMLAVASGLPPDPGPAGMATLLGVDTDNDQVRDDVQRYIALTYPASQKTQYALRSMTKTYQEALSIPNGEANAALALANKQTAQRACLMAIMGIREAEKAAQGLYAEHMNTLDRYRVYSRYVDLFAGAAFELPPPSQRLRSCEFDASSLPN